MLKVGAHHNDFLKSRENIR